MSTSEPLHIAFVWHMHQPYYRLGPGAPFEMPWARMHALKDYLDMVDLLEPFPELHQTFNLVPSLVEQLQDYAKGDFADIYWDHTLKPAADLEPGERAFVVERMCESPDHPRARAYPRYLELARRRAAQASQGWDACAAAFTVDEIRDLQVWFNLAWFDPEALERSPLAELVKKGGHFTEEDKKAVATVQQEILARTLPSYAEAETRGQIEISTSPYFHAILPLLANTDSARVAAGDAFLPRTRFAHPEDALEQLTLAVDLHRETFGAAPRGVWCSEQAVGEDVIPLLARSGFQWTISDETVLARSFKGVSHPDATASPRRRLSDRPDPTKSFGPHTLYRPHLLEREGENLAIIFRDHTLSDLIGFAYSSWDSRDAAADLLRRLREIRATLASSRPAGTLSGATPLVTIALDGENAWEYYPRDGRDFLQFLYQGLHDDPQFRCVTISEHLEAAPASLPLEWLHTGSWIGGDLRTWIGDSAHSHAWELLHRTRDVVARARTDPGAGAAAAGASPSRGPSQADLASAWHHVLAAEGSDWFWWFGDHHHTELDAVWDAAFRRHLQRAHELSGTTVPMDLFYPLLASEEPQAAVAPSGPISPDIDGIVPTPPEGAAGEWEGSGRLAPVLASTMQRAECTALREIRYGWKGRELCLLIAPEAGASLAGLEIQIQFIRPCADEDLLFSCALEDEGSVRTECKLSPEMGSAVTGAWNEVVELSLPIPEVESCEAAEEIGLVVRVGRGGMTEHVFHSTRVGSGGWEAS